MGAMVAIGAPIMFKKNNEIKKVFRTFGALGKKVKTNAKLAGRAHRLVFDMDGEIHKYWVESSSISTVIDISKIKENEEKNKDNKEVAKEFNLDSKIFKKIQELPKDFKFAMIESENSDGPITSGLAYIYVSPEGMYEPSVIQIKNKTDQTWTIVYNPLTAQPDIIQSAKTLKEIER